jgi:hypothetical protein
VFAVITTVVKYVRTVLHQTGHFARYNSTQLRCRYVRYRSRCTIQMINLCGQDIAKTFYQEREPMSCYTSSNLFDRFDLYFYANIYYGTYERYATVPLLPRYQRYRRSYWLRTNGTDPPVPLYWSVCEHCRVHPLVGRIIRRPQFNTKSMGLLKNLLGRSESFEERRLVRRSWIAHSTVRAGTGPLWGRESRKKILESSLMQ